MLDQVVAGIGGVIYLGLLIGFCVGLAVGVYITLACVMDRSANA